MADEKLAALALREEEFITAVRLFVRMEGMSSRADPASMSSLDRLRRDMLRKAIIYATAFADAITESP